MIKNYVEKRQLGLRVIWTEDNSTKHAAVLAKKWKSLPTWKKDHNNIFFFHRHTARIDRKTNNELGSAQSVDGADR